MRKWWTRKRIEFALRSLGRSPGEVARTLKKKGISGVPGLAHRCPLFRYLRGRGLPVSVVGTDWVWVEDDPVPMPKACASFRFRFDTGEYPELDDRL